MPALIHFTDRSLHPSGQTWALKNEEAAQANDISKGFRKLFDAVLLSLNL